MPTLTQSYNDNDVALVNDLRQLFIIARDHKRARYENWIRNYRLTNNRYGSQSSQYYPNPRDSEIYPILSSLVAWATDQQIGVEVIPALDPNATMFEFWNNVAADLETILMTTWIVEKYRAEVKLCLWDAFQYGVGIFKSVWDNSAAGGLGNGVLRRVDPWAFYVDPYATSLRDAEYLIELRRISRDELERRFPETAKYAIVKGSGEAMEQERPDLYTMGTHAPMANPGALPGGTGVYGAAKSSYQQVTDPAPGFILYEYWLKQNSKYTENDDEYAEEEWRVVSVCNGEVLMDELASDLWSHKTHPYERYCFDDTGEFYGISLVDHLADPQRYINRMLAALHHNVDLIGDPILVESAGSGTDRIGIVNRPGQRLKVRGPGGMVNQKPEWLVPPQLPSELWRLIDLWISRMENISGLSAMQKGATPNQRNASDVIQNVQEAAFVRIRSALQNLEDSLNGACYKIADLIVDNYTEPRFVATIGPDGSKSAKALAARHFYVPTNKGATPLQFTLRLSTGSTTPTSRQTRMAEAKELMALGVVDDEYVLQVAQIPRYRELLKRLYEKRENGMIGTPGQRQRAGRSS